MGRPPSRLRFLYGTVQPHDHLNSTATTVSVGDVFHVVRGGGEAGSFRCGVCLAATRRMEGPASRPGATLRRGTSTGQVPRPGSPERRPHRRDQRAGLCEPCDHAKQAAGWHSDRDDDTRWRPPPLPATPTDPEPRNLASSTSTGRNRVDLVFGALPRVRRPPPVRLSDAGVGGRG